MSVAWMLALLATVIAALLAAADGALLAGLQRAASPFDSGALRERERQHRALQLGRVIAFLAAGASLAEAALIAMAGRKEAVLLSAAFAVLIVTLAEGGGRTAGQVVGHSLYSRLRFAVRVTEIALWPFLALGAAIDAWLLRMLPTGGTDAHLRESNTEQFREVVAAEADVSEKEESLLRGVFSLGETEVREIMVPRVDVVGIERGTPWSEVIDRVRSSEHARFPVYTETLDDAAGILYAKDLLPAVIEDEEPAAGWEALVRPATFIPPSKTIDAQLRDFKASQTHIAIVTDEYGGTAGIVTIEDILEEIVGEIRDEYDVEEAGVEVEGTERYWVPGRLALDELSELLGSDFTRPELTTVGGLIYDHFGRVPRSGESAEMQGFRVVVERVNRRRIERVYFERAEGTMREDEEE